MTRLLLVLAALSGVTLLGTGPGEAYYYGRWCAVVHQGNGSAREICHFQDFESCRLEVVSGNRGWCGPNPYWNAAMSPPSVRKRSRH